MSYATWTKASDLRVWPATLQAREKLPALIRRLIHATVENPTLTQFPADEGIQRRGWDGVLAASIANPWVPAGASVWEMGANQNPSAKAEKDYTKRTAGPGTVDITSTTFVFVTPRKWEEKSKWRDQKRAEGKWRDVVVWDCDDLEQWIETAPAVDAWFARLLGKVPTGVRDLSSYWVALAATSDPPLTPAMFLAGRDKAAKEIRQVIAGPPREIAVSAISLHELRDFVAALTATEHEECDDAAAVRSIVIENRDAWNQLTATKNRLVLIPGEHLPLDKTMIAEAVAAGHHVVTQKNYTYLRTGVGIRLPRADRWELGKAMEEAGFSAERSHRLAREAGGCLSILVRLASKYAGQVSPAWAEPEEATALLPLALLGAWADKNKDDRKIIEQLTGETYANVQNLATRWINHPDAPLRFVEGAYSFVSREDSWRLLSIYFTNDLLSRFASIATEVLSEDDPRFEMPAGERYLAAIRKKLPKFSPELREGIAETIALLGARGDQTPQGEPGGTTWRAAKVVRDLLEDASPKRWFSLAYLLPLLAEAAPDDFLSALETGLHQPSSTIGSLFERDADGFFSSSPHTNLMWALEILAWNAAHLSRVVLILADLVAVDSGGRIHPRPAGVLRDIFRFWYPQTSATIDDRLELLDLLAKRKPNVAWSLLVGLVPQGHDTASSGSKARWRDFDTSQTKEITWADIYRQVDWAGERLIQLASTDLKKWQVLLKEFAKLPEVTQKAISKWLEEIDPAALGEGARTDIWDGIRHLVREHRFFHDAWWALPKEVVDSLAALEQKFAPSNPILRSKWLFGHGGYEAFGDAKTSHSERERMQEDAQSEAIQEIFRAFGLKGILELSTDARVPQTIGLLTAKLGLVPKWQEFLPKMLLPIDGAPHDVALGYAAARAQSEGAQFVASLPLEQWSPEAVAEFALVLKFERDTWQVLRERKPDAESVYWKRVRPYAGHLPEDELEESIRCLLKSGRPVTAVDTLMSAIHNNKKVPWDLAADTLDAASLASDEAAKDAPLHQHSIWELCELMKYLQNSPAADQDRLAKLEWRFLPLAQHRGFAPRTLHSELSRNPSFFAEVIAAQFRAKSEPRDNSNPLDPLKRHLAEAAYNLLDSWVGIPGRRPDGSIDAAVLRGWVDDVRKLCAASDRIEICDVMLGDQLSCAPADSNGTWPCEAVREILEALPTDQILRGFDCGVANQRGTYSKSITEGGEQERALAKKYAAHADKCRIRWPRTALALRRIAESYEYQAKREDERAEGRD
jgi:hypothetical protein